MFMKVQRASRARHGTRWQTGVVTLIAVAALSCSDKKDERQPASKPAGKEKQPKVETPEKPAFELHPVAGSPADVNPCALITDDELKAILGEVPGIDNYQVQNDGDYANPLDNVALCVRGSLDIFVGSDRSFDFDEIRGDREKLPDLGDEAYIGQTTVSKRLAVWVRSKERVLVVRIDNRDAVLALAKKAAARLDSASRYASGARTPAAFGGPDVDPCSLLDAAAVERILTTKRAVAMPGHKFESDRRLDYVSCKWSGGLQKTITIMFLEAGYWQRHADGPTYKPGPTIAGKNTLLGSPRLGETMLVKGDGYTVQFNIFIGTEDEDDVRARALLPVVFEPAIKTL